MDAEHIYTGPIPSKNTGLGIGLSYMSTLNGPMIVITWSPNLNFPPQQQSFNDSLYLLAFE